ncbi:MAG: AlkZ-related protein, partial [Anaerolineae bacterium]
MTRTDSAASRQVTRLEMAQVERWRDRRFRRTPERRVRDEAEARAFVDEVGLAFLFGERGVEIPTLWGAVSGSKRPVPHDHDDPDIGRVWNWKDTLPARKEIYYGKLLRGKPTLVSLALLPAVYALSPNYGDPLDYIEQYDAGLLSVEARNVYEVLLNQGALATSSLRQAAGLAGTGPVARRFDAALQELQVQLKIVKVGTSEASRWGYAYVY